MAYELKYQGSFYNRFQKPCGVNLYQDGGSVGSLPITIKSILISTNYQGDNSPVIGRIATVIIVNDSGSFDYFNDLLTNYEKEWKCIISHYTDYPFEGYLICDINEQQLIPNAEITLQFTDYIKRLEDDHLPVLSTMNERTTLLNLIVQTIHTQIGFEYDMYINSTLFETKMTDGSTDFFLMQLTVENDLFYQSFDEYDDTFTVLNKILLPFNCFLYLHDRKIFIERYSDIGRTGNWVRLPFASSAVSVASQKATMNKQSDDFEYVDTSQILAYNSGANTLKVDLLERQFNSLVFNDYMNILTDVVNDFTDGGGSWSNTSQPRVADLSLLRNWYQHSDVLTITKGTDFRGVSQYFVFTVDNEANNEWVGIYNKFIFSRNLTTVDGIPPATVLDISFKVILPDDYKSHSVYRVRFYVNLKYTLPGGPPFGGSTQNQYICIDSFNTVTDGVVGYNDLHLTSGPTGRTIDYAINNIIEKTESNDTGVIDVQVSFPLSSFYFEFVGNINDPIPESYLPETMEAVIGFLPCLEDNNTTLLVNKIGDIIVSINEDRFDNEISNTINEGFIKTEDVSLEIFDLASINYVNGPMVLVGAPGSLNDGLEKTTLWNDQGSAFIKTILDLFIENRMRKIAQTTRTLKATISCDRDLKLFTIITDNNITIASVPVKFILTNYTWDMLNGMYEIEAEEYPDTEILIS